MQLTFGALPEEADPNLDGQNASPLADVEQVTVTTGVINITEQGGDYTGINATTTEQNIATAIDTALGQDWPGGAAGIVGGSVERALVEPE